jgi:hypothetical protein
MGSVVFCVASHRHDDGRFVVVESGDERERRGDESGSTYRYSTYVARSVACSTVLVRPSSQHAGHQTGFDHGGRRVQAFSWRKLVRFISVHSNPRRLSTSRL